MENEFQNEAEAMFGCDAHADEWRAILLDITAEEAEADIRAMTNAEVEAMLREQCGEILSKREGTPPEQIENTLTINLVAAAMAAEGQPCGDCGQIVVWDENVQDWRHTVTPTGCFLARQDGR